MLQVRRIAADEGMLLRDIRLRALADSPAAFGESLAEAQARPEHEWQARALERSQDPTSATFIADLDGRWVGIAGGYFEDGVTHRVTVVSVWVDPAHRGRGIAQQALGVVARWAAALGATELDLWVTMGNDPAIRLYERLGFADTGDRQPHPSQPGLVEARYLAPIASVLTRRAL